ncbi:Uncharacterised protein [Mycobacteroides abscessus subsp. abscessus]|nr:Uncharacterised protein [Mycobacteroides abscessus subsp. abscessus]SHV33221.1 Uncharacterised protein [Mycobacteroides abscessus subsp. abscessus]SIH78197.1 Uncharacterised protein [Mycobacteroides abscessus subsp. abscessus]SII98402.1 Uncharacterised protein [Mycobacteroides abscessus subsp. abscessus]SKQ00760.1 Uncharacterised protein [Mycobacteroides abscessus subsp. abscessus]
MNRKQRRRIPKALRPALQFARCPDCNSELDLVSPFPGYFQLNISHDATCPWFTAYRKARSE